MSIDFTDEYLEAYFFIILCSIPRVDGQQIFYAFPHTSLLFSDAAQLASQVL